MTQQPLTDAEIERYVLVKLCLCAAGFYVVIAFINATTILADAARAGQQIDSREPWLLEYSSLFTVFALTPLVALYERNLQVTRLGWQRVLLAHLLGTVVFSAAHVAGMIALRSGLYPLVIGQPYVFFSDPVSDLIYEYRKDLLPYAILVLVAGQLRRIEEHRREAQILSARAQETGRLTLKSGGRTILVEADALIWAQAAGNYVEIRANGTTHLARTSLAALAEQLNAAGVDAVQVHRSWIVNRDKITEIIPTRDGDFRLKMSDGSDLRGSRRYRHLLPGATARADAL